MNGLSIEPNPPVNDASLMEDALRGYLCRRCKRAYAHDMRNGLQGIQAGFDALARAARPNKPSAVPLEQLTQFVQQAISNHERGLERVLDSVAPEDVAPASVRIRECLVELIRFLTSESARNGVRIKVDFGDDIVAQAAPAKLRLILLGLLTDSIDALTTGGEIAISAQSVDGQIQIDFIDGRTADDPDAFVVRAIADVVARSSWHIESKQVTDVGYRARLRLPPARPPTTEL